MITIVVTYRNRNIRIVKNNLDSLSKQTSKEFKVIFVDYGSDDEFSKPLLKLVKNYSFVKLIQCPVQGQLWNKSRAINIALKQTKTPCFLVSDIDLIFHPNFIKKACELAKEEVTYFQCGFMTKEESGLQKEFSDYKTAFKSQEEATGIALFSTQQLHSVGGFDEFYHGWGSEDTDIHYRLSAKGVKVNFYTKELLVKHQWHAKAYRGKQSTAPFHSQLERINQYYLMQTKSINRVKANIGYNWGKQPEKKYYDELSAAPKYTLVITPLNTDFFAFLAQLQSIDSGVVVIHIKDVSLKERYIHRLKTCVKKWSFEYLNMETINNLLLEAIIKSHRNKPYTYNYNRVHETIECKINFL